MSEALNKIYKYERQVLADLISQCTEEQQAFFERIHPNCTVENFPQDKLKNAMGLCERTIAKNNKNKMKS